MSIFTYSCPAVVMALPVSMNRHYSIVEFRDFIEFAYATVHISWNGYNRWFPGEQSTFDQTVPFNDTIHYFVFSHSER